MGTAAGDLSDVLPREFFARPVLDVARDLIGRVVESRGVAVRLTEVEAYAGPHDPASHAYRGPTPRTAVMFGPPGHLYVYFVYGMHWCANLVCEPAGVAAAVLLRAGAVVNGLEIARRRRVTARTDRDLARGPARLATVLGLTGADSGADVCAAGAWLRIRAGSPDELRQRVRQGPRVGVAAAADRPWRFWVDDDPTVSTYRPALRGRGAPRASRG